MSLTSGPDVTGNNYLDPDHAATVPHWSSDNNIGQSKYSVIQPDGNSFFAEMTTFEIINKTSRDEEIVKDKKYIEANMFGIASRWF